MQRLRFSRLMVWFASLALLISILIPTNAQAFVQKVDYVALGDSLAAGQTPDKKIDKGYTGMIAEALEKQGVLASYSNKFAVPGYTTQNVLDDLVNNKDVDGKKIQDVIKSAQLITLTAGANDLLREAKIDIEKGTVTVDLQKAIEVAGKIKANLTSILVNIKTLNPSAKVLVSGYYNAFPYLPADQQALLKQVLAGMNGMIQQTAQENQATFVSLNGLFDSNPSVYLPNPKDIHPSLDGYQLIADTFIHTILSPTPTFEDVTQEFWAYKEISLLVENKVLTGTSETHFEPEKAITRAEAAQALFRILPFDKSLPQDPGFSDVPQSHEAYMAIAKLTQAGVFAKAAKFNPEAPLTRAQMAKILTIAFELKAIESSSFKDVSDNHWAKAYINALASSKITVGYPNKTFQPEANTNRAQFAVFLVRAAKTMALK